MEFTPFPNIHWASYSHSCAIVFSLVLVCEVLLFKTNEKATTHCTNGLKKKRIYYFWRRVFKRKKCCWSVKKVDNLSVINILCESDRKSAAYSKKWRFLFVFLKLSVGYVVLELCLVYNIDIVFLKVSIKCRNAFLFFSFFFFSRFILYSGELF